MYALERNLYALFKRQNDDAPLLSLSLTGIKEASVYPGFCSKHDYELFRPIESRVPTQSDPHQAYCHFLRAVSYEYTQKRRMAAWIAMVIDEAERRNLPFDHQMLEI